MTTSKDTLIADVVNALFAESMLRLGFNEVHRIKLDLLLTKEPGVFYILVALATEQKCNLDLTVAKILQECGCIDKDLQGWYVTDFGYDVAAKLAPHLGLKTTPVVPPKPTR